jgi:type I restriction enzyme S subunit
MEALPESWAQVLIEECLLAYQNDRKIRQGWSPQCENHPAKTLDNWGVLKTSAIQDGEYIEAANKHIPSKLEPRTHLEVEAGDILITCAGPRSRCGVTCLVRKTRPKLLISGKMYQLRADPEIIDRHLLELFLRESGTKKKIDEMKTGISDSGLNLTHSRFSTLEVPLPPLNEQKRIVAKIEELFSELDAGEESLRRARRLLGVYRQSLLKQAFEGKLTATWRAQHPRLLESPEQLLASIQAERQRLYEEGLKELAVLDKSRRRPPKPKEFEFITLEEAESLSNLPHGWSWVRFGNVLAIRSGEGLTASQMNCGQFSVYGGNGVSGFHDSYMFEDPKLVIGRVGAKCGITHITAPKSWVTDNALICEFLIQSADLVFMKLLLNHLDLNKLSVSTAQPVVSGSKLNPLPFPHCSLPEQQEIVRLLDEQFTAIEQNEREIDAALKRSEALRQSILKKAFTGQLVPQVPTDEPASALLQRIRAEREASPKIKRQTPTGALGQRAELKK